MYEALLEQIIRNRPHAVALIDPKGRSWTREELADFVGRVSWLLDARGMNVGDRVAFVGPNAADFIASYFAALACGFYFVPVNWHLSINEIAHILRTSSPTIVLSHVRHSEAVGKAVDAAGLSIDSLILFGGPDSHMPMEALCEKATQFEGPKGVLGRPLFFTSATTGAPKGVLRSLSGAAAAHARLLDLTTRLYRGVGIPVDSDAAHLCQSMLYHAAALDTATSNILVGQKTVLMEHWMPSAALDLMQRLDIQTTMMVPSMFVRLFKLPAEVRRQYSVSSVRLVTHGGAPCPEEIKRDMISWWGPVFLELYGATEGGGTGISSAEWLRKPGSVGRPHPGSDIQIRSENSELLPAGEVGRIYIRPYTDDRFEYWGDIQKTQAAYIDDYFSVGDLGYLDSDGYLYLTDRSTNLIIRGGVNIYCTEVEQVLVVHPLIADCAVAAVPDSLLGEAVGALLELSDIGKLTAWDEVTQELIAFTVNRLAPFKVPSIFRSVDRLPRDPAGKLLRRTVAEILRETVSK